MMKVTLFMVTSANSVIARKDGKEDFLSDVGWYDFKRMSEKAGCFIMGRKTYETCEKYYTKYGLLDVKSKRIIEVAKIIDSKYKGKVPDSLEKLIELPGVGRKTANCVLVYAFDKPAIPVDIHVHRISNRLGLVDTKTPEETEQELMKKIPKKYWIEINDTFVMYGQNICKPISPMCNVCKIKRDCKYYKTNNAS